MRWHYLFLLSLIGLLVAACTGGDDDDAVDDDDAADDDAADDDDDTSEEEPYEVPEELAPWIEFDSLDHVGEAMLYTRPEFSMTLIDTMEELTAEFGDENCPAIHMSGPPDEVLTEVIGDCTAGTTEFVGSYSMLDIDAGSFHIYIWNADRYHIRPDADRQDVEDDEYFFHGRISYSFTGDDIIGTMDAGLGLLEYGEWGDSETGFEAHYVGPSPTEPVWNHVFLHGWVETGLTANQDVELASDMVVMSNGFGMFTNNSFGVFSLSDECDSEPLTGNYTVQGVIGVQFRFDGDTSCNGGVPVYSVDSGDETYVGDYNGSFW